jgi:hypothetical protein
MIASLESEPEVVPATSSISCSALRRPLPLTLLLALLGAFALQLWRPFFHLTDDNLTAWLPFMTELAQRFWHGQPLTVLSGIFGGEYPWLHDAGGMGVLSPFSVLLSWMLLTPLASIFCDVISTLNLFTIAGSFAWSALWLRRRLNLTVSDGWIVFLSLSYTFTPFNFVVGASWIGFINAQASAPLMLVALLHPRWRRGLALIAGAALYAIFGGHLHPFIFLCTLMSVLALAVAWQEKTPRPLFVFAGGLLATLLVALPFLVPAFSGFSHSHRAEAMPPEFAAMFNLPLGRLLLSFTLGPVSLAGAAQPIHDLDPAYLSVLAFTLGNGLAVAVLITKRRWSRLEFGLALCAALALLLIVRPPWLAGLFSKLPIYRSLRWPFREIAQLTFFAHIFLLLNLERLSARAARLIAAVSALLFATIFVNPPPTFNAMELDRRLLLAGTSQDFWKGYLKARGSRPTIIVSGHPIQVIGDRTNIPFSLLGAFDYSCLLGLTNVSGYSPTIPPTKFSSEIRPWHHSGIFSRPDAEQLVAQHPELVHVALRNSQPPVFSIIEGGRERSFMLDLRSLKISPVHVNETK